MVRILAVSLVVAAIAVATVNSQFVGYPFPYATTATSFSLPFIGGFPYAPAIAPVAPFLKAGPYAAFPFGGPFAHAVGPVVKAAYPYGPIVKTAVPAIAPVVKAAFPYGPIVKTAFPAIAKAAVPFPAPIAPAFGPVPVGPVPVGPAPAVSIPAPIL